LFVALMLGLATMAGCASESLKPSTDGSPPDSVTVTDGGAPDQVVNDPASCGCQKVGDGLTMSWACFCNRYDCAAQQMPTCIPNAQWRRSCGLAELSIETIGGPESWVYDANGTLVGEQIGSDVNEFSCPTDPSMTGFGVTAGQFPGTCDGGAVTTCQCSADGGSCDPTDAGLTF
jgi:hypothetical protein